MWRQDFSWEFKVLNLITFFLDIKRNSDCAIMIIKSQHCNIMIWKKWVNKMFVPFLFWKAIISTIWIIPLKRKKEFVKILYSKELNNKNRFNFLNLKFFGWNPWWEWIGNSLKQSLIMNELTFLGLFRINWINLITSKFKIFICFWRNNIFYWWTFFIFLCWNNNTNMVKI
jgi:hypothetical protein